MTTTTTTETTAAAIAPTKTLTIQFPDNTPEPQFSLGIEAQVGEDGGMDGDIIGLKLVNDTWHYLVKAGSVEAWAPEAEIFPTVLGFPVAYQGYLIEAQFYRHCAKGHDQYVFRLQCVESGEIIIGDIITGDVANALVEGKQHIDKVLAGAVG